MARSQEMLENLEGFIQEAMPGWGNPGLAIAVVKDDEVVFAKGFGVCEAGKKERVDQHSIFAIGSNTKAFTATALGLLVQEGKLSWDQPVTQYIPGFQLYDPYVTHEIKIRDLLCHRSGLPTWGGDLISYGSRYTREELIYRVRYIQPAFSFRSGFGYSNLMFVTAGQIIPVVTGLSWDDFVKQRIFDPLGMARSNTGFNNLSGLTNVAMPHEKIRGQIRALPYRNIDNIGPAGSITSTAWDMAQWLRLQLGNGVYGGKQLVDEAIIEETRTPHTPIRILPLDRKLFPSTHLRAYGLGWFLTDYQGRFIVRHDGGVDGMHSMVGFLPEEKLGVVVLSNKIPNRFIYALSYHIVDAYLDAPRTDWNKALLDLVSSEEAQSAEKKKQAEEARAQETRPTLPLQEYAGSYTNQLYGEAAIVVEDGKLILHLSAHPDITGELVHWHYDTFVCRWTDLVFDQSLVPFILDGHGKVEEFRVKVREDWIDPLEYKFRKKII